MSFQTGLSGLNASSRSLDVIGNNIANANTIGMKSSRTEFGDLVASSIGLAGGTGQGIGVEVVAVAQQFSQGNITITGNNLDAAINGDGFFQVRLPNGETAYTRDGSFKLDSTGQILTNGKAQLLGITADPTTGAILTGGTVGPLTLPAGGQIPADATTEITVGLNLDARATVATGTGPGSLVPPLETYGTTIVAYDMQGLEIPVNLYLTKTAVNKWQVYTNDISGAAAGPVVPFGGPLEFDTTGKLATGSTWLAPVAMPMGSVNGLLPTVPTIDLSKITQFGSNFGVTKLTQDGQTSGKLIEVTIDGDGIIQGNYSNGKQLAAGQIQLASFTNVQGLQPIGGNNWLKTTSSGDPSSTGVPGSGNLGALRSGALEESNVDLTAELVNMMTAQRAYQANAQTIKTQDQIMSTLVNLR
jgi:flagellar hook protein FlgE